MCLIIHRPADAETLEDFWLRDFRAKNGDGYGFMYVEGGTLRVVKELGTTEEFIARWRALEGREMFVHLRMRTHGDIDLENCHPYPVILGERPVWLMHNGVMSHGNPVDNTKSDTWHFIKYVLRPMLLLDPEALFDAGYQAMLRALVGTNRITILNHDGRSVTIGRQAGLEWRGHWMSNTYAWSVPPAPSKAINQLSWEWGDEDTGVQKWVAPPESGIVAYRWDAVTQRMTMVQPAPRSKRGRKAARRAANGAAWAAVHPSLDATMKDVFSGEWERSYRHVPKAEFAEIVGLYLDARLLHNWPKARVLRDFMQFYSGRPRAEGVACIKELVVLASDVTFGMTSDDVDYYLTHPHEFDDLQYSLTAMTADADETANPTGEVSCVMTEC